MKVEEAVRKRATQLIEQGDRIAASTTRFILGSSMRENPQYHAEELVAQGWMASAQNLVEILTPLLSQYRTRMLAPTSGTLWKRVGMMNAVIKALLEDIDAGLVTRVADAARAEVFDDFLDQAAYYLNGNRVPQAGVIAGVVFEDTIRRACEKRDIAQRGIEVEQLITALRNADAFNEIKAKRCRAAAGVRTKATHAQWDEFNKDDVDATIRLTRELIDSLL